MKMNYLIKKINTIQLKNKHYLIKKINTIQLKN